MAICTTIGESGCLFGQKGLRRHRMTIFARLSGTAGGSGRRVGGISISRLGCTVAICRSATKVRKAATVGPRAILRNGTA